MHAEEGRGINPVEVSRRDVAGHNGVEADLALGIEYLVEGGMATGELCRLYPIVDMLVEVGQRNRRTGHPAAGIEVPTGVSPELQRPADGFGHAFCEERGRCVRFDPRRQIVNCILNGSPGGGRRVVGKNAVFWHGDDGGVTRKL